MKLTLHTVVLITAAIAVALLADAWRSARHDSAQLAATLATQNAAIQQAGDREKQRDAQLSTALATIAAQKSSVQTAQQAAKALPSCRPCPFPFRLISPIYPRRRHQTEICRHQFPFRKQTSSRSTMTCKIAAKPHSKPTPPKRTWLTRRLKRQRSFASATPQSLPHMAAVFGCG